MTSDSGIRIHHQGAISVVIPTHNRSSLLSVAIASILRSPLIVSPEQIIVVHDNSDDQTEEVARRYGVRYVRVPHHSIGASRDAGCALAQTRYVCFLDDDDAWLPGNMEAQIAALEAQPNLAFAYGIAQCATEELEPLPMTTYPSPPLVSGIAPAQLHVSSTGCSGYPQIGTVLFRRDAIAEVGGSDLRLRVQQECDLMLRIAARHEIVGIEVVGVLHRVRAPSKARSDTHWGYREGAIWWWPRRVGVGWRTKVKFLVWQRGWFFSGFTEDAAACAEGGDRRDALVCLSRALWISPMHALRHGRTVLLILWRAIGET